MAEIAWGKPTIEIADTGENPTFAPLVGKIIDGTASLVTNKGNKKEAKEAGGDVIDIRYDKSTYIFSVEVYILKGQTASFTDDEGRVAGFKAIRLTPEDETTEGFIMPKTVVNVETTFSDNDGKRYKYTFDGVKPATGKTCQPYTKPAAP